jgi:hypothetical protein
MQAIGERTVPDDDRENDNQTQDNQKDETQDNQKDDN